jgi:hypothetical protein
MEDTSAFYKLYEDELLHGKIITGPTYTLIDSEHENYTYPVEGWYWFDSEEEARAFFGLPPLEQP